MLRMVPEVLIGDKTLFTRWDGNQESWKIIDPIIEIINKRNKPESYKAGSEGPKGAEELLHRDGKHWYIASDVTHEQMKNLG